MTMNVSKKVLHESYSNTEVLLVAEVVKLLVSGLLVINSAGHSPSSIGAVHMSDGTIETWNLKRLLLLLLRGRKLIVLVVLYSISNIIPFFAIGQIGAAAFTVVMQLKIFTTAAFSTLMLSRQYSSTKWRALLLLVIGCVLVSSPIINAGRSNISSVEGGNSGDSSPEMVTGEILGLLATLLQATISGFSSVYFEALLKDKDDNTTIWERNFQLAFYSIFFLCAMTAGERWIHVDSSLALSTAGDNEGFFVGWTALAFVLSLLQAGGGLLVAGTLKYADAVLKCFATAVSIILTSILSFFFLGSDIDMFVAIGYMTTVLSIFNYTLDHQQLPQPTPTSR